MRSRLLFSAIFCLAMLTAAARQTTLSPEAFASQSKQPGAQILDVRTIGEFRSGHIAQAVLADWKNNGQFKQYVQYLDKSKPTYVYCAAGARSKAAANWLRENGYTRVYELDGGIENWRDEKKPVEGMPVAPPVSVPDYNRQVTANSTVLAVFSASWNPPGKKMEPVIKQLQADLPNGFKLVTIDAGTQADLMKQLSITDIPTFIVYKNGKETWRKTGVLELQELKKAIH